MGIVFRRHSVPANGERGQDVLMVASKELGDGTLAQM